MAAAARTLPILPISAFAPKHPSTTSAASSTSSSIPLSSLSARIPHRHRRLLSTSLFGDAIHLSSAFSPPPAPGSALRSASTAAASATAVLFSLPTAKPERAAGSEKVPNWSSRSIKSFTMGELEARKLKYPNTGTEALLMGILVEGTSHAARFLRANGITLFKVREETVKILGKSDLYFFSPEHPPLTEPAQRALDWAVDERLKSDADGEITTTHLLLGIWSEKESAGHKILATLGFDDEKASELAKFADEEITMSNR